MGGSPVIAGTRIRVSDIVRYRGVWPDNPVAMIIENFPHLTAEQVEAAFRFYERHREEIDEEIEVERKLAEEWRARRAST